MELGGRVGNKTAHSPAELSGVNEDFCGRFHDLVRLIDRPFKLKSAAGLHTNQAVGKDRISHIVFFTACWANHKSAPPTKLEHLGCQTTGGRKARRTVTLTRTSPFDVPRVELLLTIFGMPN